VSKESDCKWEELAERQRELQAALDKLAAQGCKPDEEVAAWDPKLRAGVCSSHVASALLTRKAWVTTLPCEDNEIVTWMSTAVIGITQDGMIVESRVADYWEDGKCKAWPEPFFTRPDECRHLDTLNLLIKLANENLTS
jgi:hypothetical protein